LEEARKEIVRMKNGGNIDNIELIPISDVDELYETPLGVCSPCSFCFSSFLSSF
jgi:hypothetical protein